MISEAIESLEAALTGRLSWINTGTGAHASIRLYDGTRPASAAAAASGVLLADVPLQVPAGSVASGVMTLLPADTAMVLATGSPTWARVVNRNGVVCFDMDAGTAGSLPGGASPECVVSDATLYAGGTVAILSAILG